MVINFKKIYIFCLNCIQILLLVFLFLSSSDARMKYSPLYIYIPIIYILILFFLKFKKIKINRENISIYIYWFLLLTHILISVILGYSSLSKFQNYVCIFIFYFIIMANGNIELDYLAWACILLNLYLFYRCTSIGIYSPYYEGTAINSNQFGIILCAGVPSSCYIIFQNVWFKRIIGIITLVITFYLISLTSSRTSFFLVIVSLFLFLVYYFRNIINKEKLIKMRKFLILFFLVFIILLIIFKNINWIYNFFFNKWNTSSDDIFSGRIEIWSNVILKTPFFGNEKNLLNVNNMFLQVWNDIGFCGFFWYILILFRILRISLKKLTSNLNLSNIYIFNIVLLYLSIGMFETINTFLGKSINVLFWIFAGYLVNNVRIKSDDEINT